MAGSFIVWPSASVATLTTGHYGLELSGEDYRWISLFSQLGQCISPFIFGHAVDVVGRKYILFSTFFMFVLAWIITGVARSGWHVYIARIVGGMGVGTVCGVTPMYVGEIAEDNIRGCLVSAFQILFLLGMITEFVSAMYVSPSSLCGISCVYPVLFIVTFIWMPESPYFLMMRARQNEAERSLMILRGKKSADGVKDELETIQSLTTRQPKYMRQIPTLWKDKSISRAILILLATFFFQDFSGILSILTFVSIIFRMSGKDYDEMTAGAIVATLQFFTGIVASLLMDRVGRKILFVVSCIVSCLALIANSLFFYISEDLLTLRWFPVVFVCIYLSAFALGLGPIPFVLASEMFAMHIKGTSFSVMVLFSAATSMLSIYLYDLCSTYSGEDLAFGISAILCALGAGFMIYFFKETARRPFADILQDYRRESDEESETSAASET